MTMNAGMVISPATTGPVEVSQPGSAPAESPPPKVSIFKTSPGKGDIGVEVAAPPAKPGLASEPLKESTAEEASGEVKVPQPEPPGAPSVAEPTAEEVMAREHEKALARARKGSKSRRVQEEAKRAQEQAHRATWEADQRARMAEQRSAETLRFQQQLLSQDPAEAMAAAEALGWSADRLANYLMQRNTPEARLAAIEAKHAADLRARDERIEAIERAERERFAVAEMSRLQRIFVEESDREIEVKGQKTPLYPELAGMSKTFVLTLAQDLLARARTRHLQAGRTPAEADRIIRGIQNHEILSYLNKENARHRTAGSRKPDSSSYRTNQAPAGATGTASQPTPRTVTNSDKNETLSPPKNFDDLPDAEQKKILAKIYKASRDRASE